MDETILKIFKDLELEEDFKIVFASDNGYLKIF
jgi:hypothetical protein